MNVTLWDTSSDVRKELSIQDDRTESDNRIEVTLLIGIAENNLPHIARWESTKPPYAEPHVRWCGRSVNVKIGGKCLLWLAFTSYPIVFLFFVSDILFVTSHRLKKYGYRRDKKIPSRNQLRQPKANHWWMEDSRRINIAFIFDYRLSEWHFITFYPHVIRFFCDKSHFWRIQG